MKTLRRLVAGALLLTGASLAGFARSAEDLTLAACVAAAGLVAAVGPRKPTEPLN